MRRSRSEYERSNKPRRARDGPQHRRNPDDAGLPLEEGVGGELTELKAFAALIFAAGEGDPKNAPDLTQGDLVHIGWSLENIAERMGQRLQQISKQYNTTQRTAAG